MPPKGEQTSPKYMVLWKKHGSIHLNVYAFQEKKIVLQIYNKREQGI